MTFAQGLRKTWKVGTNGHMMGEHCGLETRSENKSKCRFESQKAPLKVYGPPSPEVSNHDGQSVTYPTNVGISIPGRLPVTCMLSEGGEPRTVY